MSEFTTGIRTIPLPWVEIPDLTFLIRRSQGGDSAAGAKLFDLAYPFLERIASRLLRGGMLERNLAPRDLIHDAWLTRLSLKPRAINDRRHYLASLTLAMKGRLIDHARRAKSLKRTLPAGAGNSAAAPGPAPEDILALERELERLEKLDRRAAMVVRLRYYGGCSWEETSAELGITVKMARGDWAFAARRLGKRLSPQSSSL